MTKKIKVSDELAKRLASHGGFHSAYAQIIELLLISARSIIKSTTIIRRKYDPNHLYRRREVTTGDPCNGVCNM